MDMVAHEHIGIKRVMIAIFIDGEELDEFLIIRGTFEYLLPLVSARNNVVECPLKFYSRLSWHAVTISNGIINVKIAIFKSDPNKSPLLGRKGGQNTPVHLLAPGGEVRGIQPLAPEKGA
jgi:hypothetical protein